jgi:hypothetical protein
MCTPSAFLAVMPCRRTKNTVTGDAPAVKLHSVAPPLRDRGGDDCGNQAITLIENCPSGSMSVMAIFRQQSHSFRFVDNMAPDSR